MRVRTLTLTNFKAHGSTGPLAFGPITVFVGPNNAGKSSILQALYGLQQPIDMDALRRGAQNAEIALTVDGLAAGIPGWAIGPNEMGQETGILTLTLPAGPAPWVLQHSPDSNPRGLGNFPQTEPHHFIIPFLSKRKVAGYNEGVTLSHVQAIRSDLHHLTARLSRISNPANPLNARYSEACERILGYVVTNVPSPNGQRSGIYLDGNQTIFLESMGEGVPQVVGLIVELVEATGKLFLIEELENDLHPGALKALLGLVIESSATNQFVVTTHSHIVTRYLGSGEGNRVYNVTARSGVVPPLSEVETIETPEARVRILRELGYELSDFDLWDAWLILEESSAERLMRDVLVPWFVPELQGRVRTIAAGGNSKIQPTVEDFKRLFLFTHLSEIYRDRAWVVVDGDDSGKAVVERLREIYGKHWSPDHFIALQQPAFESYYPERFSAEAAAALQVGDRRARQEAKKSLLEKVLQWCRDEPEAAREELADSAREVIGLLKTVAVAVST